jgi:hypothetical protein
LPDDEASYVITSGNVIHFKWIGHSIERIRLGAADGQPHVRFRFGYAGTCSWFWGVDNFGLYEINTPVSTPPTLTFTVSGTSLKLSWQGTATGRLQTTTVLKPASWTDVPGTTGASTATVTISGPRSFFRVAQ